VSVGWSKVVATYKRLEALAMRLHKGVALVAHTKVQVWFTVHFVPAIANTNTTFQTTAKDRRWEAAATYATERYKQLPSFIWSTIL
jgi:hypothetical protein